jgi:hypothetical protein
MAEKTINWLAVRTDYLAGENHLPTLARKHGIARSSLMRRMKSDEKAGSQWKTVHTTVQDHVKQHIEEKLGGAIDDAIDSAARGAVDNLQRHLELETLQLDIAIDSLKAVKDFKLVGADGVVNYAAVQARKSAIDASVKAVESSRLIHGVADEMPSVRAGQEDEKPTDSGIEIRQRRLEPIKLPVGENGLKMLPGKTG